MTAFQHVYVTAHGVFGGVWAGETAQVGLRLAVAPVLDGPDKGAIFTPQANGDVVLDSGSASGTHGTLTRSWTARLGETGSPDNWDAAYQVDIAEDVWTFLNTIKAYQRSSFVWTHVKQSPVDVDGKAIMPSSLYTFTAGLAGAGAALLPPQCALAVSLRAPIIGRRGRGRIFLPALSTASVDGDAILNTTAQGVIRTAMKDLVDDLQNPPGTPEYQPIVSVMSPGTATAVRPSQVRVGSVIDTIRSRREGKPEVYSAEDL